MYSGKSTRIINAETEFIFATKTFDKLVFRYH